MKSRSRTTEQAYGPRPEGPAVNSHDRKVVDTRSAMVASAEGAPVVSRYGLRSCRGSSQCRTFGAYEFKGAGYPRPSGRGYELPAPSGLSLRVNFHSGVT